MTSPTLPPELERLNQIYVETCRAFDNYEITVDEARAIIFELSATDAKGQTWIVDRNNSGMQATFICIPAQHSPQPHPAIQPVLHEPTDEPVTVAEKPVISRRNFLNEISAKSILVGVLGAGVIYQGVQLFDGSDEPTNESLGGSDEPADETIPAAVADPPELLGEFPLNIDTEFGRSVQNVPLTVYHRTSGVDGPKVLAIGCIHGDEFAGNRVIDILRDLPLDGNIDLYTVRSMNPDGQQLRTRQNANGVDLNRNFPASWKNIGDPGSWQYSGSSAASEPEVAAIVKLGERIKPDFVIWYHQDYFRIGPGTGVSGKVREMYARMVSLPLVDLNCLCGYTGDKPLLEAVYGGTGASWVESFQNSKGVSLTVEFGPTLTEEFAQRNAQAVIAVTKKYF